ncbi:MAG: site-specific integrase, partial [Desulfobacterales bacterium]|nr:site-specific integrase [Desulfobacterales bacterium]
GKRYKKSWKNMSKTIAKEKEWKFKTEIAEGKHDLKARRILFETFAENYMEHAKLHKKPSAAKRNQTSIHMLMPHFRGQLLESIHPFMVEQYKKARREEGKTPATVNRDTATLRNMLNKAVEWGYLSTNPIKKVKQFKEDNEQMWVLTSEEEARLLEECAKSPQRARKRYLKDLVLFALNSGMRESEIFKLKKAQTNVRQRFVLVTDTKTHENRTVPINDTLKAVIQRRLDASDSEYLFCNAEGKKLTVLTSAFWYAAKEAGLIRYDGDKKIRFRFHDLRHTFSSRLGMKGYDLKTIMEITGHKTYKTAMRYQHPSSDHKLEAVKSLDEVPPKVPSQKVIPLKSEVISTG